VSFGWQGAMTRLVPLDPRRHLENALRWLNDPEVTAWTLVGDWPLSRFAEEEFFRHAARPSAEEVFFAVEDLGGEHLGFTGLHRLDLRHGTATSGTVLGRRDAWGKGNGTDVARVRAHFAFEVIGLRQLHSEVFAENAASLRMLHKAGYREVGRLPGRYWKRGAWRDVVLMVLPRAEEARSDR
jgi:RimJ/RimL family protein N-acetyltransferase